MGNRGQEVRWLGLVSNAPPPGPVTAADVIAFIETVCFVPEGKFVGQPLKLQDWQKDILRAIYDNPHGTRRAIISAWAARTPSRRCAACLLLAHLCGPPARNRPNSELYSAAQSRDQAAIIFSLTAKMIRLNPLLAQTVRIQETAKTLRCASSGRAIGRLSAEAKTAFGLSPALIIHDELGRVRGPRSPLYEALETAVGAQEAPLSIIISTQAATDGDLLSILIDDALKGHDPSTVIKLYTAPPELDPFSEEAIKAANPAFGTFLNAREVLAMAARRPPHAGARGRVSQPGPESARRSVDAVPRPRRLGGLRGRADRHHRPKRFRRPRPCPRPAISRPWSSPIATRTTGIWHIRPYLLAPRASGWRRRRRATTCPMIYGPRKGISKRRPARRSVTSTLPSG